MACIYTDKRGLRQLQYVDGGVRKSLRLGRQSKRICEAYKVRIETILACKAGGLPLDPESAKWLSEVPPETRRRLSSLGLISMQVAVGDQSLDAFLEEFIAGKRDITEGTRSMLRQARSSLVRHFGTHRSLRSITPADADAFRVFLQVDEQLAENTIRRRIGVARQFFKAAARAKIIPKGENPFEDIPASAVAVHARQCFITREMAQAVLDVCPDAQWRLLFALARYGGMRVPSEPLKLKFEDVNWEKGSMLITSPKTKRHPGKESRLCPIFPELRPYLEEVFDQAKPGTTHFITRHRSYPKGLGERLETIVKRAGLKPWPKIWQNLRSTRETELADLYPLHVVCQWIGNSEVVAKRHYLQTTEDHFQKAVMQHPLRTPLEGVGNIRTNCITLPENSHIFSDPDAEHQSSHAGGVSDVTSFLRTMLANFLKSGDADLQTRQLDEILSAWPTLSPPVREVLVQTIQRSTGPVSR